ncbi:MAG: hypothetical protein PHC89_02305 [Candidatus Pacebacteria bacterium]|nr:hypothetical protein [Candidatus Paceibacterota bacterium]
MKNICLFLFSLLFFFSCEKKKQITWIDPGDLPAEPELVVTPDDYERVAAYIESQGQVSVERGVPSDHEYVFTHSRTGSKYQFQTLRRDSIKGNPRKDGEITQINVLCKYGGVDNLLFSYIVYPDSVSYETGKTRAELMGLSRGWSYLIDRSEQMERQSFYRTMPERSGDKADSGKKEKKLKEEKQE